MPVLYQKSRSRAPVKLCRLRGSSAGRVGLARKKNARLRARQLGQTVVSASSRLSRLDNRPDPAILASVEITGCVRHASYGDEPKLPLARLSAPFVALFASHVPCRAPRLSRFFVCTFIQDSLEGLNFALLCLIADAAMWYNAYVS
jgi:hypothetical protein